MAAAGTPIAVAAPRLLIVAAATLLVAGLGQLPPQPAVLQHLGCSGALVGDVFEHGQEEGGQAKRLQRGAAVSESSTMINVWGGPFW